MIDLVIKVAVNAAALLVAANVVPEFKLGGFHADKPEDWLQIAVIALVFALVNSYIKPIVRTLALPIDFITMGLVAFVINGAMLLGTALIVDQAKSHYRHVHARWLPAALGLRGHRLRGRRVDRDQRREYGRRPPPGAAQGRRLLAGRFSKPMAKASTPLVGRPFVPPRTG